MDKAMAFECEYCQRTVDHGHNVSHAKNRTKTLRKPNLRKVRVLENGKVVRRLLCMKCLKKAERPHHKQVKKEAA